MLLGDGDGTFSLKETVNTAVTPGVILAADFNGDGKLDLAVNNEGVSVPLGTFQPAVKYDALPFRNPSALEILMATGGLSAGHTATYNLEVTPTNGFSGNVTLSCSGAPSGTTCTVSPSSVTLTSGNSAMANVSVTTTGAGTAIPKWGSRRFLPGGSRPAHALLTLLCLILFAALMKWARALVCASCGSYGGSKGNGSSGGNDGSGGGGGATRAGTYTIIVMGRSGSTSTQTKLTLVVK